MQEDKPSIAALLGADAYAGLRPDTATAKMSAVFDKVGGYTLPDFSLSNPISHQQYVELRQQLGDVALLAGFAGDQRLEHVVNDWVKLQQ